MKNRKRTMTVLLFSLCMVAGCNDLLEEKNKSVPVSEYLNTPAGFEEAVKGAYAPLRSFYATERGMSLTVFGTDEFTNGSDGSFKFVNTYEPEFSPRTTIVNEVWIDLYRGINSANIVINRAETIPGLASATKNVRVGEARFLRAHFYFLLVQLFGGVELKLTETTEVDIAAFRSPVNEIYASIVSDLQAAIAALPNSSDWGRATRPAAQHLLARVHLTRATMDTSVDRQQEYAAAETLAASVINNPSFRLLPDYAQVFEQGTGEINDEVIWSVQYTNDLLTNSTGNNAHVFFLMEYDVQPGMTRDVRNGRPFKRFRPTEYTLGLWDRTRDSRYDKNFKQVFFVNKPGVYSIPIGDDPNTVDKTIISKKNVSLAAGDTAIWLPGADLHPDSIINFTRQSQKNFQVITPKEYTEKLYPTLTKFLDPLRQDVSTFEGSRDFLAFRLAETYLIRAEALFNMGQVTEAANMINRVRRRAAFPGKESEMEITPAQVTLDFILDERSRELLGEQLRWFDLVRTKKLIERVLLHNKEAKAKATIKSFHVLRPIPQDQIDRTRNPDGTLFGQNGY